MSHWWHPFLLSILVFSTKRHGITCYEGTRETDFDSEGILKNEDLVALHQQVEIVLNTIDS